MHRITAFLSACLLLAAANAQPGNVGLRSVAKQFKDAACGIAFKYPRSWHVTTEDSGNALCTFELRPNDKDDQHTVDQFIELQTGSGTFESGAQRGGFYRKDCPDPQSPPCQPTGEWMLEQGKGSGAAKHVVFAGRPGLEGTASSRCYDDELNRPVACDRFSAFTFQDGRWLVAEGFDKDVIRSVLTSAIFLSIPPN